MSYSIQLLRFEAKNKFSPSNCYLINTDKGFVLIDTSGSNIFNLDIIPIRISLLNQLKVAGCVPGKLQLIVLTGGGIDFAGNSSYLKKLYQSKIAIHKFDAKSIEEPEFPISKGKPLLTKIVLSLMKKRLSQFYSNYERCKADLQIDDGYNLLQYGFNAQIIHIPGHSKGAIAILTSEGDLFVGDTIANANGKPRATPIAENKSDLHNSIIKIKKLPIKNIYPGYGQPFRAELLK